MLLWVFSEENGPEQFRQAVLVAEIARRRAAFVFLAIMFLALFSLCFTIVNVSFPSAGPGSSVGFDVSFHTCCFSPKTQPAMGLTTPSGTGFAE